MKKSQIFCWDVDGVLIRFDPCHPENDWRRPLLEASLLKQWEAFQHSPEWQACLLNCHADTIAMLKRCLRTHGWDESKAAFMIQTWLEGNTDTNYEALNLLKQIRSLGYETVVISNQEGLRAAWLDRWLAQHGLRDIHRFISCRIGARKPNPDFFQAIQVAMSCEPFQLYLFDDKEENIEAALKQGWSGQIVYPHIPITSPIPYEKQEPYSKSGVGKMDLSVTTEN